MKSGKLGCGLFILTLGVAWLLSSLGWSPQGWSAVLLYWPVILILWGLSIMTRQPAVRGVLVAATAIFAAVWVVSWFDPGVEVAAGDQTLTAAADSQVTSGDLRFDSGAGDFRINSAVVDNQLVGVSSQASYGEYHLTQSVADGRLAARVWFDSPRRMMMSGLHGWRNSATVALNPDVNWTIEANVGAANFNLDASDLPVSRATISAGAATISLRLGDQVDDALVTIKAGASDITVAVPETAGVRVETSTGLTSKDLADLRQTSEDVWSSTDYDSAAKQIELRFEAGVSDIQLERY